MKLGLTTTAQPGTPLFVAQLSSSFAQLEARLARVLEVSPISGTSVAGATQITHSLEQTPTDVLIIPKGNVAWWVEDGDRLSWGASKVVAHFSAASVNFTGYVFYLEDYAVLRDQNTLVAAAAAPIIVV